MSVASEIQDHLDGLAYAIGLIQLFERFPQFAIDDIKAATKQLYAERRINRVSIRGKNESNFFVFYSLYVQTTPRFDTESAPAPKWEPIPSVPETPEPPPAPVQAVVVPEGPLTPDQAVAVLEKGGWRAEPEVVERRVTDRRTLTAMDVIDRWKLPYRLSRIIEILASARKVKLDADDAKAVALLVTEHVKKGQ